MDKIEELLFKNADTKYRDFSASLMPTVDSDCVIGVRMPILRKIAKELPQQISKEEISRFLHALPHRYYEENLLHGMIISMCKDFEKTMCMTEEFLPYIDNWAVCDMFNPKVFAKRKQELWQYIEKWIDSDKTYTVRYGIVSAMRYFLDEDFDNQRFEKILRIRSEEYYINMALAWYVSVALVKQYDMAVKAIQERVLDRWVHNKSIQKAIESFRLSSEQKSYLKTLKY